MTAYHVLARSHHPDKTRDEKMIALFHAVKIKYEKQCEAFKVLGSVNEDGDAYPKRVAHDQKCEGLREMSEEVFEKNNPNVAFAERVKEIAEENERVEIYARSRKAREESVQMDGIYRMMRNGPFLLMPQVAPTAQHITLTWA